jgi:hypothetical protein
LSPVAKNSSHPPAPIARHINFFVLDLPYARAERRHSCPLCSRLVSDQMWGPFVVSMAHLSRYT